MDTEGPSNPHVRAVAADPEFYEGWVQPRIAAALARREGSSASGVAAASPPQQPWEALKQALQQCSCLPGTPVSPVRNDVAHGGVRRPTVPRHAH